MVTPLKLHASYHSTGSVALDRVEKRLMTGVRELGMRVCKSSRKTGAKVGNGTDRDGNLVPWPRGRHQRCHGTYTSINTRK